MFGFSFLAPLFLAGVVAAALPVLLHLWRRTDDVVEFPALRYLRGAEAAYRRPRRVQELVVLALRVSALILLAVAFARPFVVAAGSAGEATIVLVDTSASLSAPGQMARVRAAAGQAVQNAPAAGRVGVAVMGAGVSPLVPLGADRAAAASVLNALAASGSAARYPAALGAAAGLFDGRPGRLVLVTDLQETGWEDVETVSIPPDLTVSLVPVDPPAENLAVTALRLDGDTAVAAVRNYSGTPRAVRVAFAVDGESLDTMSVAVPPRGQAEARVALAGRDRGVLDARIDDPVGYQQDNVRFAVLDAGGRRPVIAITGTGRADASYYVTRALSVAEGASGFRVRSTTAAAFSAEPDAGAPEAVVLVLGTRGLDVRGRTRLATHLQRGGGVLIAAGSDVDPAIAREAFRDLGIGWRARETGRLSLAVSDVRHPAVRVVADGDALGAVTVRRAALLEAGVNGRVLMRHSDGSPALVDIDAGEGRLLLSASDLTTTDSDFPLRPAFVPFVHEVVRYLSGPGTVRPEYLVGEGPGAAMAAPGVAVRDEGPGGPARVAVNVDPRESNPAVMSEAAFLGRITRRGAPSGGPASPAEAAETSRLWQYALGAMMFVLVVEGALGRRLT